MKRSISAGMTVTRFTFCLGVLLLASMLTLGAWLALPDAGKAAGRFGPAAGSVWVVNSVADSGAGSLRWALAGARAGDRINFDPTVFPPDKPAAIMILSTLPPVMVDRLDINAIGRGVVLDGSQLPATVEAGLRIIETNGVEVQGLQVLHFPRSGILMQSATNTLVGGDRLAGEGNVLSGNGKAGIMLTGVGARNNVVAGNLIGTDATGLAPLPNHDSGVVIESGASTNTIGGTQPGYGNLVSGNAGDGILVMGNGSDDNVIQGNLVGTDLTGTRLLGNYADGIDITGGPNRTQIGGEAPEARNVIAGSGYWYGIHVRGISTDDTVVQGNYIGTDATGSFALPNTSGIMINLGAKRTLVGGETTAAGNVISGNRETGLFINSTGTRDTTVKGNYIGTDKTGKVAVANGSGGLWIGDEAQNTLVGGQNTSPLSAGGCAGACNLISGNLGAGVYIFSRNTSGNVVAGNVIGAGLDGAQPLGNGLEGVRMDLGASGNRIGGDGPGEGNVIRHNGAGGVTLLASGSTANVLTGNQIEDNQGTAIRYRPGNLLGNNTCRRNEYERVEVVAGVLAARGEQWQSQGELTQFLVVRAGQYDQAGVTVPAGATWTIGPGVEVLFDFGLGAEVRGALTAAGSADRPVTLAGLAALCSASAGGLERIVLQAWEHRRADIQLGGVRRHGPRPGRRCRHGHLQHHHSQRGRWHPSGKRRQPGSATQRLWRQRRLCHQQPYPHPRRMRAVPGGATPLALMEPGIRSTARWITQAGSRPPSPTTTGNRPSC